VTYISLLLSSFVTENMTVTVVPVAETEFKETVAGLLSMLVE
jgi:hypothetical protein